MFSKNVGKTDRIIRGIVGVVALLLAFTALSGVLAWIVGIVGVVMLATALLGTCPPYAMLGINTNKAE